MGEKWYNDVVDRREDFAIREHRDENENMVFLYSALNRGQLPIGRGSGH
jgi:hypothetical protein